MTDLDLRELWGPAAAESPTASARARALRAAIAAAGSAAGDREATQEADAPGVAERDGGPAGASGAAPATPVLRPRRAAPPRGRVVAVAGALAIAASVAFFVSGGGLHARKGDVTAALRTEIDIGGRARAVLEPSAHVAWSSPDLVTQTSGSVFYRVEHGGAFRVHTPEGDVTVLGTCFRVKLKEPTMNMREARSGAIGALGTAAVIVLVYEGKVAVSHAGQSVAIVAGEAAESSAAGVRKTADGERAADGADPGAGGDSPSDPTMSANKNLVASVSDYRARLEQMDVERRALEQQLADAKARLDAIDAGTKTPKLEVTADEWQELVKDGTVKARVPCSWRGGWYPSPKQLDALGLGPADAPVIQAASNRLYESSWAVIRPICEKIGGKDIADRIGLDGCPNFILQYNLGVDKDGAHEAMRRVSEMRAGLRPTPPLDDPSLGAVERVYLVLTGQQRSLESDLARSLGPDEAHRLVTSEAYCGWSATWTGPGPRKKSWGDKTRFE